VFGTQQIAQNPLTWRDQLDHTKWTENVMKHMPTRARRVLQKQGGEEAFSSIVEAAGE
jgi:hypothetical protein